ncbi:MAG: T9SS type A sorting domain-containing protein [Bernardetiaceae bacterium]|nr:T9SS type A sorting domain-containing protein [Bernardetiaceae bacterium]
MLALVAQAQIRPAADLEFFYPLWTLANPTATTTTTPTYLIGGFPPPPGFGPSRSQAAFVSNVATAPGNQQLAEAEDRYIDPDNESLQMVHTSTANYNSVTNPADDGGFDNYIELRQADYTGGGYSFPESGTISIWAQRANWAKGANKTFTEVIVNNGLPYEGGEHTFQIGFAHGDGINPPGFSIFFGGTNATAPGNLLAPLTTSTTAPVNATPNGSWNHLVVTWQRSVGQTVIRLFLNGVPIPLAETLGPPVLPPIGGLPSNAVAVDKVISPTELPVGGTWAWGLGRALRGTRDDMSFGVLRDHYPFDGRLAEFRLYRRVINECEVEYLYKEGLVTVWTGAKDTNWNDPENWTATTSATPPAFPTRAENPGTNWGTEVGRFRTGGVPSSTGAQTVIIPHQGTGSTVTRFPIIPTGTHARIYQLQFGNIFRQITVLNPTARATLEVNDQASLRTSAFNFAVNPSFGTAGLTHPYLQLTNRASFVEGPCSWADNSLTFPIIWETYGRYVRNGTPNGGVYTVHPTSALRYNYWSSPVRAPVADAVFANPYRFPDNLAGDPKAIFRYQFSNQPNYADYNNLWQVLSPTDVMNVGQGYAVAGGQAASFGGPFNNGPDNAAPLQVTLSRTASANLPAWEGFNLVGNPFPSPLSIERFLNVTYPEASTTTSNLAKLSSGTGLYFWQDDNNNLTNRGNSATNTDDYTVCTLAGCTGSPQYVAGSDNFANGTNGYIPVAQGFLVRAAANNNILRFTNAMRLYNGGGRIGNDRFFRPEADGAARVRLSLHGPTQAANHLLLTFGPGWGEGLDHGYDALKLEANPAFAFYSLSTQAGAPLAIQALGTLNGPQTIELGFNATQPGAYQLRLDELALPAGVEALLHDREQQTYHRLATGAYPFTLTKPGRDNERFTLLLRPPASPNEDDGGLEAALHLYPSPTEKSEFTLRLEGPTDGPVQVRVLNLAGQPVAAVSLVKNRYTFRQTVALTPLAAGVYLVETHFNGQRSLRRWLKQ